MFSGSLPSPRLPECGTNPKTYLRKDKQTIEDHADLMNSASDFGTAQRMLQQVAAAESASRAKNQQAWAFEAVKKRRPKKRRSRSKNRNRNRNVGRRKRS